MITTEERIHDMQDTVITFGAEDMYYYNEMDELELEEFEFYKDLVEDRLRSVIITLTEEEELIAMQYKLKIQP